MTRRLLIASCCLFLLGSLTARAQAPASNFSATPTSGCGPLHVQFTDQSTGGPLFWNWDFGNGQTSTAQNPLNVYASPGTYTVSLTTRNRDGVNTMTRTGLITVYPYPTASFTSNLTLACAPATVQFTNTANPGQGTITAYSWNLGDGTLSNQPNPSHAYTQTGYYDISLAVTNSGGCSSASNQIRYLRVIDGIQPNFNFNQTSTSCAAPYTVTFINQTAGPGNLSYNWSLGNGAVPANSTDTSPANITYPSNGSYTVSLQVQSSLGCSQTIQKTIPFTGSNLVINGPGTACVNTPVTFTNASTPPPASTIWSFGDGTNAGGLSPSKTYNAVGTYTVKMVNKNTGCADSTTKTISVVARPTPAFSATGATSACKPNLTVSFQDNSTGSPTKWLWDFGDGNTDTTQNPTHTYTSTGSFNVTLTASSAGGCSAPLTKNAFINIQAPTVVIDKANSLGACVNNTGSVYAVTPTALVTTVDPVTGYTWSAPGSNEGSSTSATPSFTYNTAGSYNISVTVTTAGGCVSAPPATSTVLIGTSTPATFSITPSPVCGANPVTFTSTGTPADHWKWDFGDGTNSGSANLSAISHAYRKTSPPVYTVTLTAIHNGCPTNGIQTLTVNPPLPNFGYKVNCPNPLSVNFNDSSYYTSGGSISYTWDFGDGSPTQTVTTAPYLPSTHLYPAPSPYTVTLTINDGSPCSPQTAKKTITLARVTPSFTNPATACKNTTFTLASTSTVVPANPTFIVGYSWQVGGAAPASGGPTYSTTLPGTGIYPLSLTVTDTNGCVYTTPAGPGIQIIGPTAAFSYPTPSGGCKNGPAAVTFTDNSTTYPAGSTIVNWSWDWGNGTGQTFTSGPFTHTYTDTGTYSIKLTVQDSHGCYDGFREPGTILITAPVANFSGPDSFYCPGVPFTFIDSSQGHHLQDSWNFGDGKISSNPTHSFANSGQTYNVTLTITDTFNCTSSLTKPVRIQKPIAAFDIADTVGICIPLQTYFTSHGQYYDSLYWSFGDGTTSTLPVTSHFYNSYGSFHAVLYLRGPGGCYDTTGRRILLLNPDANTQFNYSPLEACDSVPVQFAIKPPPYTSFEVNFGDGFVDTTQNPGVFHMYRHPAPYHPTLILTDVTGCIYPIGGQNRVIVLGAMPFFSMSPHSFCDSAVVKMIDYTNSNDGIVSETYTFSDGSPSQTQNPGTGSFNVSNYFNKAGTWLTTLKVVTNHSCTDSYTDTVRVYQTPHPTITITSPLCNGMIQFQGGLTAPQVDTIGWAWSFGNGQTSALQSPTVNMKPGNYTVTLRADVSFGCADTVSSDITVNAPPLIKGPKEITTPLGIPVTIPFTYGNNVVSYNWTPTTNLNCFTCPNPVATLLLATQYAVTVTDSNKCTATDSILIKTICNDQNFFLPNTFSPNGDGVNDYFYPRGSHLYNVQSLTVFNRWGQMVFQRRDFPANAQNMGWDGNFNGHPAPADAYVYIVEMICENAQVVAIHGSVTLVR